WPTGSLVRRMNHESGDQIRRLALVSPDGELTDLSPYSVPVSLLTASADVSPDGHTVATSWSERTRGGETRTGIVLIDTATQRRTDWLPADDTHQASAPRFSRDGARIALIGSTLSSASHTPDSRLAIAALA